MRFGSPRTGQEVSSSRRYGAAPIQAVGAMQVGYFGSKATSGLCQPLIAMMPPHAAYIETHLGGGAIMQGKPPALRNIGIDRDARALDAFEGTELVYCDPPYLKRTRRSKRRYWFDWSCPGYAKLCIAGATPVGDPQDLRAIRRAFCESTCRPAPATVGALSVPTCRPSVATRLPESVRTTVMRSMSGWTHRVDSARHGYSRSRSPRGVTRAQRGSRECRRTCAVECPQGGRATRSNIGGRRERSSSPDQSSGADCPGDHRRRPTRSGAFRHTRC